MSNEVSFRDGGSGGMQLAAHQSLDADPGPMEYAEASSSLERELDEEDRAEARREEAERLERKAARKQKRRRLWAREAWEMERGAPAQQRELA